MAALECDTYIPVAEQFVLLHAQTGTCSFGTTCTERGRVGIVSSSCALRPEWCVWYMYIHMKFARLKLTELFLADSKSHSGRFVDLGCPLRLVGHLSFPPARLTSMMAAARALCSI